MSYSYDYSGQEAAGQLNQSASAIPGGSDPAAAFGSAPPQGAGQPQATTPGSAGQPQAVTPVPGQDSKTTLWMGELEPWMDENFIRAIWSNFGETVNVKMIRDKFSGSSAGYCFVDFAAPAAAAKAITLNGTLIPNTQRVFKLNWASGGGISERREDRGPEFSIFVGDLAPETTEYALLNLFQSHYPSCKSAKIMTDPVTGVSRGYGFVRFGDETEMQRALSEMQGFYCGSRPMRISTATPKNRTAATQIGAGGVIGQQGPAPGQLGMYQMGMAPMGYYGAPQPINQFTDPNNTTVFVGGLSGYVTEDELRGFFSGFGEITYVKIPPGKGCGFVQFVQRHAAEMAINQMQGYPIGNSRIRLSWGRSQNNPGSANAPYRPTAPPPPVYPSMGLPPQHHYSSYAPLNPHASHIHPSPPVNPGPVNPDPIASTNNETDNDIYDANVERGELLAASTLTSVPINEMNHYYLADRENLNGRLTADSRGYNGVFTQ